MAKLFRLQYKMIEHDVLPGALDRCQVCGSEDLVLVLDVGHQPLCDSLLSPEMLNEPETYYPLRLNRCKRCTLAQLDYVVDGRKVFHSQYPYRSGITKEVAEYQRAMSADLIAKFNLAPYSFVVDIGSNDGTLLSGFKERSMRVLGIEPTDIGNIAKQAGVETVQAFFTEALARDIVRSNGHARVITATNVFAHMASLGEVIRGILALLDDDGVFVSESHYLMDIIKGVQYDTIYHEHIRSYSLKSLVTLFDNYGLKVFHVERVSRYGGNIRVYVSRSDKHSGRSSVRGLLDAEADFGLQDEGVYEKFRQDVYESRSRLVELAVDCAAKGLRLVGKSCPGRANTLLNFCDINVGLMPYISEQPTSLKKGLYLPGKHIPVVDDSVLFEEQPDYVVLLAWHYADPISKELRSRGLQSKFVIPLPKFTVVN